ncbi:ATP-binding cassette domain-containing protein [Ferrovibrio sp.]|uniref:ATP-binding cassette domain-containing protein n=1 Tax=Ferrovibrio sp. TaxID=1917215 RepID=UPI0025BF8FEE|nr:ATP-binding cassette domain-containing protein [Ferrovibrio sp.]MBX3454269.1 ATP-binding cassette domain-containing protein [Ferrovibrio sp.]
MARITARDIEVIYPVVTQRGQSLRLKLMHYGSGGILAQDARGIVNVRALSGIDFDIREGDRVGLVGRNGAGKSTLLRVLAGIYHPSRGELKIEGEVSAILGLGLGIDEELSGHETIDYALMMRGVPRDVIPSLHDEIAAFTELEDYLQLPVRTYSSGMKIRLAFGVATSRRPDILLLDEGIGAGDAFFLQKARRRAESFVDDASILVIASHSDDLLLKTCNKGLLLDRGQVIAAGPISDVIEMYRQLEYGDSNETTEAKPETIASSATEGAGVAAAFDGSVLSHWHSTAGDPTPWIGQRFEEPTVIRTVTLRQWSGRLDNTDCVHRIALQTSNDDFQRDIREAGILEVPARPAIHTIRLPTTNRARCWRVAPMQDAAMDRGWGVTTLRFHVEETGRVDKIAKLYCDHPEHRTLSDCLDAMEHTREALPTLADVNERSCLLERTKLHIIRLRRGHGDDFAAFDALVRQHLDFLRLNLSSRWLISILDSYADGGSEVERSAAILASGLFNWEKLGLTRRHIDLQRLDGDYLGPVDLTPFRTPLSLWDGMTILGIPGDMPRAFVKRLRRALRPAPHLAAIFEILLERALDNPQGTLNAIGGRYGRDFKAELRIAAEDS